VRVTNTDALFHQIQANLDKLDQSDPWVVQAQRKLAAIADPEQKTAD